MYSLQFSNMYALELIIIHYIHSPTIPKNISSYIAPFISAIPE
jgi:hypothetical protein